MLVGSFQGNYSFSRLLTLSSLIQMDTANTQAVSANFRLRWNYRPDSDLYIIYKAGTRFARLVAENRPQFYETASPSSSRTRGVHSSTASFYSGDLHACSSIHCLEKPFDVSVISFLANSTKPQSWLVALLGRLNSHKLSIEQQIVENLQPAGDEKREVDPRRPGKHKTHEKRTDGGTGCSRHTGYACCR